MNLSNYILHEQLHESSNSIVYRAVRRDAERHYPVVLKILPENSLSAERVASFKREYEITRRLDIESVPSVIKVYALEQDAGLWVMVLEDFGGESLARLGVAGKLTVYQLSYMGVNRKWRPCSPLSSGFVEEQLN